LNASSWLGEVGLIMPAMKTGALEELIRILPDGIGVLPLYLDAQVGSLEEFVGSVDAMEQRIAELARAGMDLIHQVGAPYLMVHGLQHERELVSGWEAKYGVPVLSTGATQVEALRALGVTRVLGVTFVEAAVNARVAQYFRDAGLEVVQMEALTTFSAVDRISAREVYARIHAAYLRHPEADGIYMLGSGWRVLDIVEPLEQDLRVPVVQANAARSWAIQNRLRVRRPIPNRGRLLADMPLPVSD
jgi:maleate cis-trans isomerase